MASVSAGDSAVGDSANKSPDDDESSLDTSSDRGESNLSHFGPTVAEKSSRRRGNVFPVILENNTIRRFTINRVSGVNSRK